MPLLLIGRADVLDIVTTPNCCQGVTSPALTLTPIPTLVSGGSSNVFIGGKGVHRVGDATELHAGFPPLCVPHIGVAVGPVPPLALSTVFVNGAPVQRMTDIYSNAEILTAPQVQAVTAGKGMVFTG